MQMETHALTLLFAGTLATALHANNIQVTNTTLVDNTGSTVKVQFDVTWENSWRGEGVNNWDAAWVFVKYKLFGDDACDHVDLQHTGHVAPSGCLIDNGLLAPGAAYDAASNPVVGVFIRRDVEGTGTFVATGVQLLWDYSTLGVFFGDISEVRVYAIEMVYINEGAFHLGSGGTETSAFKTGNTTQPYHITSEDPIQVSLNQQALWATGDIVTGPLAANFPKGFAASYMMKYEISQQQYVDFLNSLTRQQQDTRTGTDLSMGISAVTDTYVMSATSSIIARNAIRCDSNIDPNGTITFYCDANGNGTGGEADDGLWVACGFLHGGDMAAYLDWSGLRPMTELEFEKACRGALPPLVNEFPWRSASICLQAYALASSGAADEAISSNYSTTVGNANYSSTGLLAPARVGIYAAHPSNAGRTTAGAGYYGTMELAGNLWEFAVSLATTAGQAFPGTHGDGRLSVTGQGDQAAWPTQASGYGTRGGTFSSNSENLRVSDREFAGAIVPVRANNLGGRGVRTAP